MKLEKVTILGAVKDKDGKQIVPPIVLYRDGLWDCDKCIKFPCALQEWSSDKNKKLRPGECGDRETSSDNED